MKNREIKFRIYHEKDGMMYFGDVVASIMLNGSLLLDEDVNIYPDARSRFKLMQYTGLKDKNGKEIYEGDIVSHQNPKCRGMVKLEPYEFGVYDTFTQGVGWYFDYLDDIGVNGADTLYNSHLLEVIGNIYENPELL